MTYLGFLSLFLAFPLVGLSLITLLGARRSRNRFVSHSGRLAAGALLVHVVLAVTYTTPWDNYLVATRVWWYDPTRVLGVTLGWVPVEEYLFFILQTLFTGLFLFALARRLPPSPPTPAFGAGANVSSPLFSNNHSLRIASTLIIAFIWLTSVLLLALGWKPGTYLGLELVWALPPIALQLAVGADIIWRYRRSVLPLLFGVTFYLCAADFIAIGLGVWTIDPAQSLNILVGGVLPVEEVIFFLLTNTLIVFGLTLALAPQTRERLRAMLQRRAMTQEQA
jgi:lycopene cyclase domain-containing protein